MGTYVSKPQVVQPAAEQPLCAVDDGEVNQWWMDDGQTFVMWFSNYMCNLLAIYV